MDVEVCGNPISNRTKIDSDTVSIMNGRLRTKNRDHIMEELRISLNTWNKILVGEPIRSSVAHRLIERFGNSKQ